MTKEKERSPYSGSANYGITGSDSDKIGPLFTKWLLDLEANYDVRVTSYHYSMYYNHSGLTDPGSLKKARHPNENGEDSFSVRAGE